MIGRIGRAILAVLAWTLLVCYPLPWLLPISLYRVVSPPVDAASVSGLSQEIEASDPAAIENAVLNRIPYQYDWETYGVPWYFPTPAQAIQRGAGDCKARFVVLASVLEHRGIPYRQRFSAMHFWVDYEGKDGSGVEAPDLSLLVRDEEGNLRLQRGRTEWDQVWQSIREAGWDAMPTVRKWLMFSGWAVVLIRMHRPAGRRSRAHRFTLDRNSDQRA